MLHTALHDWHASHRGRMVDFAGWEMPIQYTSIIEEHIAVRTRAGLFDIAHMGRLRFRGEQACAFLDRLLTNDVTKLNIGQIRYSLVCNEAGGILDDVLVYRFDNSYMLVVNASNRQKIVDWIGQHISEFACEMTDETLDTFMLAIQGPRAIDILGLQTDTDLYSMGYYTAVTARSNGADSIVSRTGYTGEDGFEVILPRDEGEAFWETLLITGDGNLTPCGLGCRDTLRIEAAMPLYGHEIDESIDPLTAGLSFGVKLKAGDFIGREALLAIKQEPQTSKRVGLQLQGRRIAREQTPILRGDDTVGKVTSGTFSPTIEQSIAMGYVPVDASGVGTSLAVDIRGQQIAAEVVPLPFYSRSAD